jgi:hypothetical protein
MGKTGVLLATITTTVLLSGCHVFEVACPAIAQASGVSVTVAASHAPAVKALHLKACQDGLCREAELELAPGFISVDQGCTDGSRPDGSCSATSKPDRTKRGMLMLDVLTESPMEVTASGTSIDGSPLPVRTLRFTPPGDYPFGEQCGRFVSASVVLDEAGLHQDR